MNFGCVIWGCGSSAHARGLCHRHYAITAKKIRAGETCWNQEFNAGRARAKKKTTFNQHRLGVK